MKKLLALIAAVALLMCFTACGKRSPVVTVDNTPANIDPLLAIESPQEAAHQLFNELYRAAQDVDTARFHALFGNTLSDDAVAQSISTLNSLLSSYDQPICTLLFQNERSYIFNAHFPSLSDPADYKTDIFRIVRSDVGWRFTSFNYNVDKTVLLKMYKSHLPDDYLKAKNSGRICEDYTDAGFPSPSDLQTYCCADAVWMFADETNYVGNSTIVKSRFAWETETGDIAVALWCNNGTDREFIPTCPSEIPFGNTIIHSSVTTEEVIKAHSNKLITITIPASQWQPQDDTPASDNTSSLEESARENGSYPTSEIVYIEVPPNDF